MAIGQEGLRTPHLSLESKRKKDAASPCPTILVSSMIEDKYCPQLEEESPSPSCLS